MSNISSPGVSHLEWEKYLFKSSVVTEEFFGAWKCFSAFSTYGLYHVLLYRGLQNIQVFYLFFSPLSRNAFFVAKLKRSSKCVRWYVQFSCPQFFLISFVKKKYIGER